MKTTYGPITLEPLTGTIGAEIVTGAVIGHLDDETATYLHQAWVDWKVLFFRDQHVSVEDHIAFGRQFGELEIHPFLPNDGHPEIVVLDTQSDGPTRAERWHTDQIDDVDPDEGRALLARLLATVNQPTYQVRFRWRTNSFALWDNRSTQHCAAQDFGTARRRVERVTLLGERPFGPANVHEHMPISAST